MQAQAIEVSPLSPALGATVSGLDLARPLEPQQASALAAAFAQHKVLFFHDQSLSPEQLIAFSGHFGRTVRLPFIAPHPDHEEIIVVLKEADERRISTFGGSWHSDFSFLSEPPAATALLALEVPPFGGDTLWVNMVQAYESLSEGLRSVLDGLVAIHSGAAIHGTKNAALASHRLSPAAAPDAASHGARCPK